MRELKFRAWGKDTKKFLYIELKPNAQIKDDEWRYNGYDDWEQYTGLKDKNGKEIYEGDILRWKNSKFSFEGNGVVEYEHGGWCVTKTICTLWACVTLYKAEIIGNIHENPELVEGGK